MHVIIGITSYERDTEQVKKYIENLKEVEYLREVKIYDIVCHEHNADFIATCYTHHQLIKSYTRKSQV